MPSRLALANVAYLEQGLVLLARIDDAAYTACSPPLYSSGVGGHFRHCLDHYQQLLTGLPEGRVDYDARSRDRRVEHDRSLAQQRGREIAAALAALDAGLEGKGLQTRMDCGDGQHRDARWERSTLGRELQFMVSHTTHHYALIALILRHQGIEPGPNFGVAASTLQHARGLLAPQG